MRSHDLDYCDLTSCEQLNSKKVVKTANYLDCK